MSTSDQSKDVKDDTIINVWHIKKTNLQHKNRNIQHTFIKLRSVKKDCTSKKGNVKTYIPHITIVYNNKRIQTK